MGVLNGQLNNNKSKVITGVKELRYEVVATMLQERRNGITKPLKLPSEKVLAAEYNVSRDTIRRSMKVFEERGEVVRQRGKGTFLLPKIIQTKNLKGTGVGFIPPWWASSTRTWYTSMVFEGICKWADEHDWYLAQSTCSVKGQI